MTGLMIFTGIGFAIIAAALYFGRFCSTKDFCDDSSVDVGDIDFSG